LNSSFLDFSDSLSGELAEEFDEQREILDAALGGELRSAQAAAP